LKKSNILDVNLIDDTEIVVGLNGTFMY